MTTFAPDAEREFALFQEQVQTTAKRDRTAFVDWLAEHLHLGGEVYEHYQPHNAVRWTLKGTQRILNKKSMPFCHTSDTSPDQDPEHLAEKLMRRQLRYGVSLSYARS